VFLLLQRQTAVVVVVVALAEQLLELLEVPVVAVQMQALEVRVIRQALAQAKEITVVMAVLTAVVVGAGLVLLALLLLEP
jgi:hypothetical protein